MDRSIMQDLVAWKAKKSRTPLILKGVRQSGKTYVLKAFGKAHFPRTHYFNFEQSPGLAAIFEGELDPSRILLELSFQVNEAIRPETDLIIFDEIQACPRALTSLKYFCEQAADIALCAAGSLLGLHLNDVSFPVGKVTFLHLYPMSFLEFLHAVGEDALHHYLRDYDEKTIIPRSIHERFWECLKIYFVVGGMPAVINAYLEYRDIPYTAFERVREKQNDLIVAYQADIAKHSGKTNAMHIDRVWRDVPAQLARSMDGGAQKFKFKGVLPGVDRYQRMADTIDWLCAAELVIKVPVIETPRVPLSAHIKESWFKLYMNDVGLLGAMSGLPVKMLLDQNYGSYKGYFAENYVAQSMLSSGKRELFSWQQGRTEVEFLTMCDAGVIPIEVKSGHVTKAQSLQAFIKKYSPSYAIIYSAKPMEMYDALLRHYPLYVAR